jgi:hypothetical protein
MRLYKQKFHGEGGKNIEQSSTEEKTKIDIRLVGN